MADEKIYSVKEIAKLVRLELGKAFPKYKFSITSETNMMYISLIKADFHPLIDKNKTHEGVNQYWIDDSKVLNEEGKKLFKFIKETTDRWNWDNSDSMTDYFDVNFYLDLNVGKWDKEFEVC